MVLGKLVNGVQHVGVPTADMEKTLAFYHGLGFETAFETALPSGRVVFLKLKNLIVETYESEDTAGRPGAIDHVALDVSDVDAAYAILAQGGYTLLDKGVNSLPFWARGVRFFTIQGPNGEKLEFSQMQ